MVIIIQRARYAEILANEIILNGLMRVLSKQ